MVEWALRDIQNPIGVSSFRVTEALPTKLRGSLPTVEQLEAELGRWPAAREAGEVIDPAPNHSRQAGGTRPAP